MSTAGRLKLSRRQYYRDRQVACLRICRAFAPSPDEPARRIEISDPLALLFARAAALSDGGLSQKAVTMLDTAWSAVPQGAARFVARLELADALISFGDVARAGKLLDVAPGVLDQLERGDPERSLRDRTTVVKARLARAMGRDVEAGRMLDDLVQRHIATDRCDLVALDALIEAGLWHCSNAAFVQARRALVRARVVRGRQHRIPSHVEVALSLLEAYCVEDATDAFQSSHRCFAEALELSRAHASVRGALEATVGLMGYYASTGCEDAMYRLANDALDIARSTEGRMHVRFAIGWIATTFMKTGSWRAANPLIFEAEQLFAPGTLHWTFLKEAQADYLARCRKYDASQASFAAARDAAVRLGNPKWQAIVLRDQALALKELGWVEESVASMRRAVDLADKSAGAWSRSLTHAAAAKVLSKTRDAAKFTRAQTTIDRLPPLSLR